MVRALLDGRKTQTRSILKPQPEPVRFAVGMQLWVREAWIPVGLKGAIYRADGERQPGACCGCLWKPSIHMPRWASRLTLTVTGVRVQRLQDISEADCIAEGIWSYRSTDCDGDPRADDEATFWHWRHDIEEGDGYSTAVSAYKHLWDKINGAGAWGLNPWIVAVTFAVENRNIDAERIQAPIREAKRPLPPPPEGQ